MARKSLCGDIVSEVIALGKLTASISWPVVTKTKNYDVSKNRIVKMTEKKMTNLAR